MILVYHESQRSLIPQMGQDEYNISFLVLSFGIFLYLFCKVILQMAKLTYFCSVDKMMMENIIRDFPRIC